MFKMFYHTIFIFFIGFFKYCFMNILSFSFEFILFIESIELFLLWNINYNDKKDIKININDNIPKFKKIKRLIDLNSPLMNDTKKKKIMQNISTNNYLKMTIMIKF